MLNLKDLQYFVAAVEHGGFAAASRSLDLPKSTLSKRVAQLEQDLGVRLIHRSSRSFSLSEAGAAFFEHARAALIEAEAAEAAVHERLAEPRGRVKLTMSVPTAQQTLAGLLPELARRYPMLQIQVDVTDRFVDLIQEGYDIAIRSHFAPLPDSGLIMRQLKVDPFVLLAAPAYLAQAAPILTSQDLSAQDGLMMGPQALSWNLQGPSNQACQATPRTRLMANESTLLLQAAEAGLGIVCLPAPFAREALAAGRLVRILPDWTAGRVTTTLLMPSRRGQLPGVRAVVEFLAQSLKASDSMC